LTFLEEERRNEELGALLSGGMRVRGIWRVLLTMMLEVLAQAVVKGRRGVIQLCYKAEDSTLECEGVE